MFSITYKCSTHPVVKVGLAAVAARKHPGIDRGADLECPESSWKFCLLDVYPTHPRGRRNTPLPNLRIYCHVKCLMRQLILPRRKETLRLGGVARHPNSRKTLTYPIRRLTIILYVSSAHPRGCLQVKFLSREDSDVCGRLRQNRGACAPPGAPLFRLLFLRRAIPGATAVY